MKRALALGLVAIVLAACASETVNGSPFRRRPVAAGDDDDDTAAGDAGTAPAPTVSVAKPVTPAPPTDSGPPPRSSVCNAPNLAFCYAFDGTTNENTNALTPATLTNVTLVAGRDIQAASFVAGSAMRFAPNAIFELPANAAVEAWIKRQNVATSGVILDDDGRFSLTIDENGNVLCKSSGGAVLGTKAVPVEAWAHVACVVDAGTLHAYLDGVDVGSGPGAIGSAPTLGAAIGGNSPDGEGFLGLIDSLRVFKVARTAAEVSAAAKP